jgi:hypothetical protein
MKVIRMEKNLSAYISKLMELDSKAVDLKEKRDSELVKLESDIRNELECVDAVLDKATLAAKQEHNKIIEEARLQAREIDEAAEINISKVQAYFTSIKEDAAEDIWKQLLAIER